MPLEKKILSKRHLRRKRAETLSQFKSDLNNDFEKHNFAGNIHQKADNAEHNIPMEVDVCPATNLNCNIQHAPFLLALETQSIFGTDLVVSSNEIHNDVRECADNIESVFIPDYSRAQFTNIDRSIPENDDKDRDSNGDQYTDDHDHQIEFQHEFRKNLQKWACDFNITHVALDELLALIHHKYPFLPKTAKSLLRTQRKIEISNLKNGQMCYIGVRQGLESRLRGGLTDSASQMGTMKIDVNIDGLPLFKSSSTALWPILCRSHSLKDSSPFMVAVFCGKGKPDSLDSYFCQFIEEMNLLMTNGIIYNNQTIRVEVGCFLCDAPARAMLKMIKGHTSTYGCEKCTIAAVSCERKLYYPVGKTHCKRRDDDYLRDNFDSTHIKGLSPLLRLLVKLVTQFPLDPMHLIYLGVVKRLLIKYWIEGNRHCKLSKKILQMISEKIESLQADVTAEFNRKPRSLDEVKRWKATEFRFFLVYLGPIVLRNVLDPKKFRHFLLLHTAVYILSNETLISCYLEVAKRALEKFVQLCAKLYGPHFNVYNVHSLLHLCDDVEQYGKLQDFSCFPFENYLGTLKKRVRAKRLPLQQVVKRISELTNLENEKKEDFNPKPEPDIPRGIRAKGENAFECDTLQTKRFKLSIEGPDNIVTVGTKVYTIKSIICLNGVYKCVGIAFRYLRDLYRKPIESSKLGIFFAQSYAEATTFLVDEISFKCLRFPFEDGFGIFPILHQRECNTFVPDI